VNDVVLSKVLSIDGKAILELGAGSGYFMPMLLRRYSGQRPRRVVISDQSRSQLAVAKRFFRIDAADYMQLDCRSRYPMSNATVDLIISMFVFNEVTNSGFERALAECYRVLSVTGRCLFVVTHPEFIVSQDHRGEILWNRRVGMALSSHGIRLPTVMRSVDSYLQRIQNAGFRCQSENLFASDKVMNEKPGLRRAGRVPIAWVLDLTKSPD
jgi:ubiquinone/menaquinone biosynthesis C-methylase UbiE